MNQLPFTLPGGIQARSIGVKLIVICALALLMTISSVFVSSLVNERAKRAAQLKEEISSRVGGSQTFLGPTLAIPYTVNARSPATSATHGVYLIFPVQASANLETSTTERHRSLFRVPVYQADLTFDATFDLKGTRTAAPQDSQLDWSRAEIVVGVSDPRGALSDARLSTNGQTMTMVPAELAGDLDLSADKKEQAKLFLLGAKAADFARSDARFRVHSTSRFSGAERVAVLAYGKTTVVSAKGNWTAPKFDGGILPVSREISKQGYSAQWSVPFIARGVGAEGRLDSVAGLNATALGVSFIELADAYQSVHRSLKYVLLILGLVFLSYFAFEVSAGRRIHPAQYILVGIAQMIFYLLFLSISERIGFDLGFLIAASATVALLATNAGWILSSRLLAIRGLVVFGLLYVLIYLLLKLEDNALLVGSIASFLAVAIVMYLTRRLDWYSSQSVAKQQMSDGLSHEA